MDKHITLKDGTDVLIRPIVMDDLDQSCKFFLELPEEERIYICGDVTQRDVVRRRIRDVESERAYRLVALIGDNIVADGAMLMEDHCWGEHAGEMRLIVANECRHNGLGMQMVRELYSYAASQKIDEIITRFMQPEASALNICHRFGFQEESVLPAFVKDHTGKRQDLVLMRCSLHELWQKLEGYLTESDWQRRR